MDVDQFHRALTLDGLKRMCPEYSIEQLDAFLNKVISVLDITKVEAASEMAVKRVCFRMKRCSKELKLEILKKKELELEILEKKKAALTCEYGDEIDAWLSDNTVRYYAAILRHLCKKK